jgi:hypothetical protein
MKVHYQLHIANAGPPREPAGQLLLYVGFRREGIWKAQRHKPVFAGRKRLRVEAAGHLNQFVVRQFVVFCFGLGHEISPSVGFGN